MIALLAVSAALGAAAPGIAHDTLSGGLAPGALSGQLSLGFPAQSLSGRAGLAGGWTAILEGSTTLGVDSWGMVGVGRRWLDRPALRLGGEALLGGHLRTGELAMKGPALSLRVRAARGQGRLVPYALLETRHTLLLNRTVLSSAEGESSSLDLARAWSPLAVLGCAVALTPGLGLDLGLDLPWLDPPVFSIPGFHLGLEFGR